MNKLIMAGVAGLAGLTLAGTATPAFASTSAPAHPSASKPACDTHKPHCFGAIAVGGGHANAFGISTQAGSASLAHKEAVSACAQHASSCKVFFTNENGWFAMAEGSNRHLGAAGEVGTSKPVKSAVEAAALKTCKSAGGTHCRIVAVANAITGSH